MDGLSIIRRRVGFVFIFVGSLSFFNKKKGIKGGIK